MTMRLDRLPWKLAQRAVPQHRRSEVVGTLNELYDGATPLKEAVRTVTSGVRMRNRAEATSTLDLWRIGARNAVVLYLASFASFGLGMSLFHATTFSYQTSHGQATYWVLLCVLSAGFTRGRFPLALCFAVGFPFVATLFTHTMFREWRDDSHRALALVAVVAVGIFLARRHPWMLALIVGTAFVGMAGIVRTHHGWGAGYSVNGFDRAATSAAIVGLVALAFVETSETSRPLKSFSPTYWPLVLGLLSGFFASWNISHRTHDQLRTPYLLMLGFTIALVESAVALITVRPQLFLTCFVYLVLNVSAGYRDVSSTKILTTAAFVATMGLVARFSGRRGLRA